MTLDRSRWKEVEEALDAILQAEPAAADEMLHRLGADDPELEREVRSLLAAHGAASEFLEIPASDLAARHLVEVPEESESTGSVIGRYRLLEEIGRGGMGTVWLAERADGQFEQRVALKLVQRGMNSPESRQRFLHERQILARLQHPHIARLLDGGMSDDGRPYFVMEYVPGTPITRYCESSRLTLDARMRLFILACRAVQYAHRSLIVHRDIKPANVLITDSGDVKLLDFGVATLLAPGSENSAATARLPMTPGYASPEQLAGGPVHTASDVYQLGVLLWELASGKRPERTESEERREVRLEGDLDAVARRALEPDTDRRYPSADALADDVERVLAHRPLGFGSRSWRHRSALFLRRHRLRATAATVATALGLVLTLAYLSRIRTERDSARREAAKAVELSATLRRIFWGWSPDAADRGKVTAQLLLSDAAQRARTELAGQPELLASTLSMLGDMQAGIGNMESADSLLASALRIQEAAVGPEQDLGATLVRQGSLRLSSGRLADAESLLRKALTIRGLGNGSVTEARRLLGVALFLQDRLSEAESLLRVALAEVGAGQEQLATEISSELGYVLFLQARYADAVGLLRPTLAAQRRLFGQFHASTLFTMRRLASSLRGPDAFVESEALDREALAISMALYGADHRQTGASMGALAVLLERKGDFVAADTFAGAAVEQAIKLYGESSGEAALMLRTLGGIRIVLGNRAEAEQLLRRSLAAIRRAFPKGHSDEGDILNRLAYLLTMRGAADADSVYRMAVKLERARVAGGPYFVTDGYDYLAWTARRRGDALLADSLFQRARTLYEAELPDGHPYRIQAAGR